MYIYIYIYVCMNIGGCSKFLAPISPWVTSSPMLLKYHPFFVVIEPMVITCITHLLISPNINMNQGKRGFRSTDQRGPALVLHNLLVRQAGMRNGINNPNKPSNWWCPLRVPLRSFPPSLLSTSKTSFRNNSLSHHSPSVYCASSDRATKALQYSLLGASSSWAIAGAVLVALCVL